MNRCVLCSSSLKAAKLSEPCLAQGVDCVRVDELLIYVVCKLSARGRVKTLDVQGRLCLPIANRTQKT